MQGNRKTVQSVSMATILKVVRFKRYLVRNYPITSAMSYEIGEYVASRLLNIPKKTSRSKLFTVR